MTRERITVDDVSSQSFQTVSDWPGAAYEDIATRKVYKAMWDVVTANFHERMQSGEIINNSLYQVMYDSSTMFYKVGNSQSYSGGPEKNPWWLFYQEPFDGFNIRFPRTVADIDTFCAAFNSERDVAINATWSDVDVSEIQALASLGELPETIRWLANIMRRFRKLVQLWMTRKRFVKSVWQYATSSGSLTSASNFWLEWRYAVRPLVFECAQAARAMHAILSRNSRITGRGFHKVVVDERVSVSDLVTFTYDSSYRQVRTSTYRGGVLFQLDADIENALAIWGLDQPLESAWELVPFSFIMDWFFDIGNTIAAWTDNPGLTPLTSWITEEHSISASDHHIDAITPASPYQVGSWNCTDPYFDPVSKASSIMTIKRRLPTPPRSLTPSIKVNLDLKKLTDLAAIGQVLYSGLKR